MKDAVYFSELPTELLIPDAAECAARLRVPLGYRDPAIDEAELELRKSIRAAMVALRLPIRREADGALDLGGLFTVRSEALKKNLQGCGEAYLLAVTLGMETERLLHRLSLLSPAKHFLSDALASAYAEAAAELANQRLAENRDLTNRFSPGYADLPLSIQPDLLTALEANKYLHITLRDSFLMVPQKSITAIIGIRS